MTAARTFELLVGGCRHASLSENEVRSSFLASELQAPWITALPWLAVLISSALYAAHFFFGGGASHRILDSWAYLQVSSGQPVGVPFNTRILTPYLAALIASVTGLSTSAGFNLLTPAALLGSLLALRDCIRKRGGSLEWQAAILLAFGCSLAVTFGYTPVLVDPTLLLVTCLTIAALERGHLLAALALACIAALTKEFGVFLGPIWALYAYRRGFRTFAYAGSIIPVAALLIVLLARQSSAGVGFPGWPAFASHLMFEYQLSVFRVRGPGDYAKLLYMWSWCGVWPVFLISMQSVVSQPLRRMNIITESEIGLAVLLIGLPVLLLGDWSRNLIILVPFACLVATTHPLARNRYFVLLIAIGGLSTALARPFHVDTAPVHILTLTLIGISAISSILVATTILRFAASSRTFDSRLTKSARGVA